MKKTMREIAMEEQNKYVLIHERKDREGCMTANGILICRCGKCKPEDYELPVDFPNSENIKIKNKNKMAREIKFRAWDNKEKSWLEPKYYYIKKNKLPILLAILYGILCWLAYLVS